MDKQKKLSTLDEKKTKQYELDTTIRKQTHKTLSLLQTTVAKDQPNIVFMRKSLRTSSQHGTQKVNTHNRTT